MSTVEHALEKHLPPDVIREVLGLAGSWQHWLPIGYRYCTHMYRRGMRKGYMCGALVHNRVAALYRDGPRMRDLRCLTHKNAPTVTLPELDQMKKENAKARAKAKAKANAKAKAKANAKAKTKANAKAKA